MLPRYGSVVAGASGIGVQESPVPYCGHGGAGGVIPPAARCAATVFWRVDMKIGFADAAVTKQSEETSAAATTAAERRVRSKRPSKVAQLPLRGQRPDRRKLSPVG